MFIFSIPALGGTKADWKEEDKGELNLLRQGDS